MSVTILGIESSCDDTSAALLRDGYLHSNVISGQEVHRNYGGVVPELASRAHQQHIIPVVDEAFRRAGMKKEEVNAVAFTQGPGLLGSLMVGTSFAKAFALAQDVPLIGVNHLQAHILAHFIRDPDKKEEDIPSFPFLCLLVSGGHTQLTVVRNYLDMEIIGETIDDAAGEAFDKCGKIMDLPYPSGPVIDKNAREGNPLAFEFTRPRIEKLNYSFSGLKTAFLYFLRDKVKEDAQFIEHHFQDLCASLQYTIIDILMNKLIQASEQTGIRQVAIAGGVSANSGLKNALNEAAHKYHWNVYVPKVEYTMDNAAMIAMTGHYKYLQGEYSSLDVVPKARFRY
ncbi:MAG TPA: tRNA (adenosine(37)-N6)-threonylcarbamoyltransferase complex transferase subunit TsaD [Bacteroidales bacterium]|nr:tRNA (adenosine(37)-N6)-threonylcarbamoyltransferase complex transferase subunit TsaD [Bacteroidales bacterium]